LDSKGTPGHLACLALHIGVIGNDFTGGTEYSDLPLNLFTGCPHGKISRNFLNLNNPGFKDVKIRDSLIDIPLQEEL
jgi:hypothetical protein